MNISTKHISQCNQSEPLVDASGKMVDLMNENGTDDTAERVYSPMVHTNKS